MAARAALRATGIRGSARRAALRAAHARIYAP